MAINPIAFTEKVVSDFLTYQLTTYPLADERLHEQLRRLLNLDTTRDSPLLQGPYISLSRAFAPGASISDLIKEGIFHPGLASIATHASARGHQEDAFRAIHRGETTIVSTGTGSGKTECFLYPIISRCLELRDEEAPPGLTAVLVYPMNALAEDQLDRLRELLCGTGITFGLYVGKTPERRTDVTGARLPVGASRADYIARRDSSREQDQRTTIHPPEEACSRQEMRERPPRILLTNVKQLELLLTRATDLEIFDGAKLDYMVFDEAHTFTGAQGAETACLIRRLRTYCGRTPEQTVCVATSATITDPASGLEAGRDFASRFFGVDRESVALVTERYEADTWPETRTVPPALAGDVKAHLKHVLEAIDAPEEGGALLRGVYQGMTGQPLKARSWAADLYDRLGENEVVYQLARLLETPRRLADLLTDLSAHVGRAISEEELLIWLALCATASRNGRPRLRPVLHGFIRGVGGAVVTLPTDHDGPRLYLSAEDASAMPSERPLFRLPLKVCTTCGQHYMTHHLKDFKFEGKRPEGGDLEGDGVVWLPLDPTQGGVAATLVDRLVGEDDGADDKAVPGFLCRCCGALHPDPARICRQCGDGSGLVRMLVVKLKETRFSRCLACGAIGRRFQGRYREPARAIRAVTVSDVHVLAQSMIHHAERRRLLLFSDNRQDAAFQAGWMQDHARRYRLRALMLKAIPPEGISVGDLTFELDRMMDADDHLSKALLPEVWRDVSKGGKAHVDQRRYFLRIQVLRELTTGPRQRIGLEPWGRLRVVYQGLEPGLPFFHRWSERLGLPSEQLVEGVAAILDHGRRKRMLYDARYRIYSHWWQEGDRDIQTGFLPFDEAGPQGLRLTRRADDRHNRVAHWFGSHPTTVSNAVRSWGVPEAEVERFLSECWDLCTRTLPLLATVQLTGVRQKALPGCEGVRQVDVDQIMLFRETGVRRCRRCRATSVRDMPRAACMAWRCGGTLVPEPPNPEDYDLRLLDEDTEMLRVREHSAQVPSDEREHLESTFKGSSDAVNTLVCTPTLELGVDIGNLDGILMRNVPPRPANYWQRAGRAGRRHRMAVNLTYARPASHDQAYFQDPVKLLGGRVDPPRFNLRNPLMVAKHVRAAVLTVLFDLTRERGGLPDAEREALREVLRHVFPQQTRDYLFDGHGHIRPEPLDVRALGRIIDRHRRAIDDHIAAIFGPGWPAADAATVDSETLRDVVTAMPTALADVLWALKKRLDWATSQMDRLAQVRKLKGVLDPEEQAVHERCERLVKRLKGLDKKQGRDAEGYDDTLTYAALAAEGFLPGYGLESGSVRGTATIPRYLAHARDYVLPRPPAIALREYFPGNILYANGHRFIPRFHQLGTELPMLFQVHAASGSVVEVGASRDAVRGLDTDVLRAVPIPDVIMPHQSNISDEEEYRFQPPAAIYGYERDEHGPGTAFGWGGMNVLHRTALRLRLVNVGATAAMDDDRLGYPICIICGQSRSPFASQRDLEDFSKDHHARCNERLEGDLMPFTGLYADVIADALTFQQLTDAPAAYTLGELLRRGASAVLDMELEDLHLLVVGKPGTPEVDLVIYDPMPGGSGLLDQLRERWGEVVAAAHSYAVECPGCCERACVDCLMTFRNAYYHRHLDRVAGAELLAKLGAVLEERHPLVAKLPRVAAGDPQTVIETRFKHMLARVGFPEPICQHPIKLGRPFGDTIPDFFYPAVDEDEPGIAIYLDGMSQHLHGNPETAERDHAIREQLRRDGYAVITVASRDLDDLGRMTTHFRRLAKELALLDLRERVKADTSWFDGPSPDSTLKAEREPPLPGRIVKLPLLALRAAAGGFGEHGEPEPEAWLDVEVGRDVDADMFLVRVVGRSMEPTIPDGAYCVFKRITAGSRQGKVVLAQHRDIADVDNDGGTYTVKRYRSTRRQAEDGEWEHETITLMPDNPAYEAIELMSTEDQPVRVVAEYVVTAVVVADEAWREAHAWTDASVHPWLEQLRAAGGAAPNVGVDLTTSAGKVVGTAELAWPSARAAALAPAGERARSALETEGWVFWKLDDLLAGRVAIAEVIARVGTR